jgi:hypothetical protein
MVYIASNEFLAGVLTLSLSPPSQHLLGSVQDWSAIGYEQFLVAPDDSRNIRELLKVEVFQALEIVDRDDRRRKGRQKLALLLGQRGVLDKRHSLRVEETFGENL